MKRITIGRGSRGQGLSWVTLYKGRDIVKKKRKEKEQKNFFSLVLNEEVCDDHIFFFFQPLETSLKLEKRITTERSVSKKMFTSLLV